MDHRIIGMQILAIMVQDINPPAFTRSASKFRKAGKNQNYTKMRKIVVDLNQKAGEFRDTQLLDICKTAFNTLKELVQHNIVFTSSNQEQRLQEATLSLLIKCFSYDFNGTNLDESGEDVGIVQVCIYTTDFFDLVLTLIDSCFLEIHV